MMINYFSEFQMGYINPSSFVCSDPNLQFSPSGGLVQFSHLAAIVFVSTCGQVLGDD